MQRRLVWSAQNYFRPLWVPYLERRFELECNWHLSNELVKIVWLLATVKLEYVIPGYHKYKHAWGTEINEKLNNN